ncbi:hypothetical protein Ccrd_024880 [Cynara cardunculus var. scolymus]|uniref:Pentatricopeptide repeat-containing protein n=1 Tax=Cynara cardunculus var. scolymus TaxID=59895 RepID=A0A103XDR2_CYNCS|nr:hypothetical protein Ccrd_024880 [Cynara cardunculus var. scolymus]
MVCKLSTRLMNICVVSFCKVQQLEKAEAVIVDAIRLGKPEEANKVFQDIVMSKLSPCSTTFNTMLNGLCKNGYTANALMLFRSLQRHGFIPQ